MHWKLSFLIGTPIGLVLLAAFIVGGFLLRKYGRWHDAHGSGWDMVDGPVARGLAITSWVAAVATVVIMAASLVPYKAEYFQWRPVSGAVDKVDSRFNSKSGDGVSETYVVTVDGQPYRVDDNRATTLDKGDTVSLMCTREWQWASNPGYACRWNQ